IDSWYQNRYQLIAVGPQPVEPPDRTGVVDAPRRLLEQDLLATSREVDEHRGAVVVRQGHHRAVAVDVVADAMRVELVRLLRRPTTPPQRRTHVEERHLDVRVHEVDRAGR